MWPKFFYTKGRTLPKVCEVGLEHCIWVRSYGGLVKLGCRYMVWFWVSPLQTLISNLCRNIHKFVTSFVIEAKFTHLRNMWNMMQSLKWFNNTQTIIDTICYIKHSTLKVEHTEAHSKWHSNQRVCDEGLYHFTRDDRKPRTFKW